MPSTRARLSHTLAVAVTAALTTWVATWSWQALVERPGGYLNPLLLLALLVAGVGAAARWWRWPGPAVLLAQIVVGGATASLLLTGSPVPVGAAGADLAEAISDALTSAERYAAPVPTDAPPVDPLLILGGLACLLLVDLQAATLQRAALAGVPLLAVLTVPVSIVGTPVSWWTFALATAGYLTMILLQESERLSRWGRPLAVDPETGDPVQQRGSRVRGVAALVGAAAIALAIAVPAALPSSGVHLFDIGPGRGGGTDIRIENPVADLVRDLRRGDDLPLLRLVTDDPNPSYLRILALTRFNEAEWSPGDRDVPADQLANGQLPPQQGVSTDTARTQHTYQVSALPSFDSTWLPTRAPVSRVEAEGDWRYDTRTMDFLAGDDDLSTAGISYTMTALDLDIRAADLQDASPPTGKVDSIFTELPDDVPDLVTELAEQVTEGATTRYERAVALQRWFRETGGFTYSLDRAAGNGIEALETFLSTDPGGRVGYCEQFASAMAVMARALDIPARVAVGFLTPTSTGGRSWVYSAHDMHAWPELYFDGAGWVRFEPTPAARAGSVPGYTNPGSLADDEPSASATAAPSSSAAVPSARPQEPQGADDGGADDAAEEGGFAWGRAILVGLAVLAGAALLLLPRLVRSRRRRHRLRSGEPDEVWAEIFDTAVDLGVPWPEGRSVRTVRDVLVGYLGQPVTGQSPDRPARGPDVAPAAASALQRLVHLIELHRYSRTGAPADPVRLTADGEQVVAALAGGATRRLRRRATWWPRSVLRRSRPAAPGGATRAQDERAVDRVGADR